MKKWATDKGTFLDYNIDNEIELRDYIDKKLSLAKSGVEFESFKVYEEGKNIMRIMIKKEM